MLFELGYLNLELLHYLVLLTSKINAGCIFKLLTHLLDVCSPLPYQLVEMLKLPLVLESFSVDLSEP